MARSCRAGGSGFDDWEAKRMLNETHCKGALSVMSSTLSRRATKVQIVILRGDIERAEREVIRSCAKPLAPAFVKTPERKLPAAERRHTWRTTLPNEMPDLEERHIPSPVNRQKRERNPSYL